MRLMMTAAAALVLATPLAADDHAADLETVLAADLRDEDRARDQYRNPAETLEFFGVEPTMTVAEYGPGGGWYTRVLAPWLNGAGSYIAFDQDSDTRTYRDRAQEARAKGWTERFKGAVAEMTGGEADDVMAFEIDEMPEGVEGTVDRALGFGIGQPVLHGDAIFEGDAGLVIPQPHDLPRNRERTALQFDIAADRRKIATLDQRPDGRDIAQAHDARALGRMHGRADKDIDPVLATFLDGSALYLHDRYSLSVAQLNRETLPVP